MTAAPQIGLTSVIDLHAAAYDAERTQAIVDQFHRDGFYFLGPILNAAEVAALHAAMVRKHADPAMQPDQPGDHARGFSLMRMFEYDRNFRDLVVREPLVSLAEAILGENCHVMSQNALRTEPGQGVTGWHVDDKVFFPVAAGMGRHDPRLRMPCFVINMMVALTDIDDLIYGPTQLVPGSHYAGRAPGPEAEPQFDGHGPRTMLAKAGDAYFFHNQVWHRGAPNTSDRVRYVGGAAYSQRAIAQRFYPFVDYRLPEHVLDGADERLQRLFGRHAMGAYG